MLVKTKFANIIIAAKKEIIPNYCNPIVIPKIFEIVSNYLDNPQKINKQISKTQMILKVLKQILHLQL